MKPTHTVELLIQRTSVSLCMYYFTIQVLDTEEAPQCVFTLLYRFMYEYTVYTTAKNIYCAIRNA